MNNNKLNLHFQNLETDYLYHLGLDSSMNLQEDFANIKYVIFVRDIADAAFLAKEYTKAFYNISNTEISCKTIAKDERYHMYKIENVIIISHGVGSPSLLICINEITKLLWHAKVKDFAYIRIGPGGGLGNSNKNNVIVAHKSLNYQFEPKWHNIEFGEHYEYSTTMDNTLTNDILNTTQYSALLGDILHTQSFYNGQARINGAIKTSYTTEEAMTYLTNAFNQGVRAIDMESGCFCAFCNELEIPASMIIATNSDRLLTNTITENNFDSENIDSNIKDATKLLIDFLLTKGNLQ